MERYFGIVGLIALAAMTIYGVVIWEPAKPSPACEKAPLRYTIMCPDGLRLGR